MSPNQVSKYSIYKGNESNQATLIRSTAKAHPETNPQFTFTISVTGLLDNVNVGDA